MSRMIASRMGYEAERTTAFGAITASYVLMGAVFTHPIRIVVLQNDTNTAATFSLDGSTPLITLQAGVSIVLDITAARTSDPQGLAAPINWGVYVKYVSVPGSGAVYASAIYGAGAVSIT
jgi:hypothetical protein